MCSCEMYSKMQYIVYCTKQWHKLAEPNSDDALMQIYVKLNFCNTGA